MKITSDLFNVCIYKRDEGSPVGDWKSLKTNTITSTC